MLTQNDIEEALSWAYVFAVAARAGVNVAGSVKDYGVDGTFRQVVVLENGNRTENGFPIDFQLKASINCSLEELHVVYDMEATAYNKLVYRRNHGATPMLLILMTLPRDADSWVIHSEDELLIRQCCYWYQVGVEPTDNNSSVRVRIPRQQQLTPNSLHSLFELVKAGQLE